MRPHDGGACGLPPPRRPHLPASERRASAPQPRRRQSARDRPGNCSPPPRRAIPRPRFASRYRRGSAGIRGKLRKRPARRTVPPPPSAGCSSTLISRVGAAEDMRARKTLDAVGQGTVRHPLGRAVPSFGGYPPAVLGVLRMIRCPTAS